jgi:hypothetical protein
MAFEPFGLVGGVTVGIPPVLVIDSNGNVTSNRGNIANLSTAVITSSGNITAPFFIGNIVGNVSGNFVVPGTNTSVIFNQAGNAGASDNLQFNYSTNVLSLTGNLTVTNILTDNYRYANGAPYVFAAQASGSNTQIQFNTSGLLDASANLTFDSSNQTFATDNISAVTAVITELESDNVLVTGNVVAANVIANFIGNLSNANLVSANFFTGVLTTHAQPNITSVGTLSGLTLAGNVIPAADNLYNLGSNVARWKDLFLSGNTIYIGNAIIEANSTALIFTNPNGSNYVFGGNDFSISGNISAGGNLSIGNISAGNLVSANFVTGRLTTESQPNITTVGTLGNLSVAGNINTGNISAVTRVTANQFSGLLITGDQPNVTSVGTLASLSVTGNITSISGRFIGNGSGLSQITAANIVGNVSNATYAINAGTATTATNAVNANTANVANIANTATTAETVTTNAQPNITSVGTLTTLNVTGNVNASNFVGNFVGNITSANFASYAGNVTVASQPNITSVGTLTSLAVNGPITAANITANTGRFIGNGSGLSQLSAANIVGTVANATYAITAGTTTNAGTVTTNAQPNITSVGTLTSLAVTGNITGGNVAGGNLVSATYFSGTLTTGAQPNITSVGTLTSLAVSGNITATNITSTTGRFAGNGSGLTNLSGANIVGTVANATYAVSAGSANTAGTVTTNAQPNITSIGTLTSLIVSGNITGANISGGNLVSANYVTGILTTSSQPNVTSVGTLSSLNVNGNITSANITSIAGRFAGNGSGLSNLSGSNVVGAVANATYAVSAGTSTTANTVIDNAQPNITSVGTLTSLIVSGNITGANINGGNLVSANYFSGTLTTNAQANITLVGTLNSLAVNGPITAANITANTGRFTGNGSGLSNLSGANVVGTVANATYALTAESSTTADTVTGNAQPNITSVGTLTSLSSTGNITAPFFIGNIVGNISGNFVVPGTNTSVIFNQEGNAGASNALKFNYNSNVLTVIGNVVSNYFIGNGSRLSQLTGANVIGNVANATYAVTAGFTTTAGTVTTNAQPNITSVGLLTTLSVNGNITGSNIAVGNLVSANYISGVLTTNAQPNITSVGTLSSLAVSGNITAENITANTGKFTGNGSGLSQLVGSNVVGTVANATYAVTAGNSATAGTVYTNAQPNITSVGTLTSLAVSGNITGSNVAGGNLVSANYITGTLTTGAQPNVTSLGTLTALNVNGNITSVNFTSIAGRFAGNGSGLSNLSGSNVVGTVANATYAVTAGFTTTAGTVTTNAQPNITSVGTLTSLIVSGNIDGANVAGGNLVSANYVAGTLTTGAQPNITSVGTLTSLTSSGNITAPYFFGNLIGNIDNANYAAYAGNVVNPLQPNITTVGTLTSLSVSGNIIGGNLISANFLTGTLTTQTQSNIHTVGNLGFLNVDTTVSGANGNITFNGSMSGTGPQSDIDITGDLYVSNIYSTIVAGVLSTNEQPNVTLLGTLTELTVRGPADLGSISNVTITGGSANYILSTDGAGNLSWAPAGSGTAAGSNTQVQFNNEGLLAGNSTFTFNNVTKTLTVLGNILSNSTIQASKFISNVATGTAPFTVTSTTKVANLSVETANTASFATNSTNSNVALTVANAAQPNITSVGTLTELNVNGAGSITGNIRVGNLDTNGTIVSTNTNVVGNANVNGTLQVGSAGQLKVLGTVNTASSSNVYLGNVANIHIEGGINGYVLSTDGAGNLSWSVGGGGGGNGVPGGSNTQVQYNDAGVFGGSSFLTFNEVTTTLQVAGNLIANSTQVGAGIYKFSTQYVYFATTASTSPNQVLWSTSAANVSGVDFHVIATDASGSTRQSSKISSLLYGNSVAWNEYGGLQLNGGTGSFSVDYDPGDIITPPSVRLIVTPDSANSTTYKMMITEYAP